jgi:4-hydroxy-3-polyprenylbenzoate decarboxylase
MPLRRGQTMERGLPLAARWSKLGPPGEIPRARAFEEDGRGVHREVGGFEPGEQPE